MALTYSKQLYLHLNKCTKRNLLPALGSSFQNVLSVVYYSDTVDPSKEKLSRAMKSYLEKAQKFDQFMKQQLEEYDLGKRFLAGMMGRKSEEMSQKDIDEAIDYLFPSNLYVPKSRPIMKPPEEVFKKHKEAMFDNTGRPFHFLFYTSKPNYSQCLHDAATVLERLNQREWKKETAPPPLILSGGKWMTKVELEGALLEKLYDIEYERFIEVFTKLSEHKFASSVESFIRKYWVSVVNKMETDFPVYIHIKDGVTAVKVEG